METLLQNGSYMAVVKSHALAESGEKKTPSVKIKLQTLFNINTPSVREVETVYWDGWLSDAAFDRTADTLYKVYGWTGMDVSELNSNQMLLYNIQCIVVIENEEYNGKLYPKVKFVNPIGGGTVKPLEDVQAKIMSEKLKGKILAFRENNKWKPAPNVKRMDPSQVPVASSEVSSAPADDDIPPDGAPQYRNSIPEDDLPF